MQFFEEAYRRRANHEEKDSKDRPMKSKKTKEKTNQSQKKTRIVNCGVLTSRAKERVGTTEKDNRRGKAKAKV